MSDSKKIAKSKDTKKEAGDTKKPDKKIAKIKNFDKNMHDILKLCSEILKSSKETFGTADLSLNKDLKAYFSRYNNFAPEVHHEIFTKMYDPIARIARNDFGSLFDPEDEENQLILKMSSVSSKLKDKLDLKAIHAVAMKLRTKFTPPAASRQTKKAEYFMAGKLEMAILETIMLVCPLDDVEFMKNNLKERATHYGIKVDGNDDFMSMAKKMASKVGVNTSNIGQKLTQVLGKDSSSILKGVDLSKPSSMISAASKLMSKVDRKKVEKTLNEMFVEEKPEKGKKLVGEKDTESETLPEPEDPETLAEPEDPETLAEPDGVEEPEEKDEDSTPLIGGDEE